MADGKTEYLDRADGPRFAAEHPGDLPFLGWACGRNDGYATWQEHIDMVKAMTEAHHGFAFAWNNGGHGEGGRAMQMITKYYPAEKFARQRSYPAFGNSSIDDNMGAARSSSRSRERSSPGPTPPATRVRSPPTRTASRR
jgi:hypothetical protein